MFLKYENFSCYPILRFFGLKNCCVNNKEVEFFCRTFTRKRRVATILDKFSLLIFDEKDLLVELNLSVEIRPAPRITAYRNKCQFTIGKSLDGNICVGFVRGRFSDNQHYILPIDTCDHISEQMKRIVKTFEKFVVDGGYPVRLSFNCCLIVYLVQRLRFCFFRFRA